MIVYAVNVHTGGGKVLLDELLEGSVFGPVSALFVDSRFEHKRALELGIETHKIAPQLHARFKAETELQKIALKNPEENILFFGNLPPRKRIPNRSILYLQSCFLLYPIPLPNDSFKVFVRTILERLWLKFFLKNIDEVWVQTNWMVQLFKPLFPKIKISLKPFFPKLQPIAQHDKKYDLISVTSLSNHKNLNVLFEALEILDKSLQKNISVMLVLDSAAVPIKLIAKRFVNIDLSVKSTLTRSELGNLYALSRWSAVTSSYESFCLPIYESAFYGVKILALDTPFSRESGVVTTYYSKNTAADLAQALKKI